MRNEPQWGKRSAEGGTKSAHPHSPFRILHSALAVAVAVVAVAACGGGGPFTPRGPGTGGGTDRLIQVSAALDQPVFLTVPPGDGARLFVVEKTGAIRVFHGDTLLATPFLDLSSVVSTGSEQGLLGLAFHPTYAVTGQFFVSYTDTAGDTRVLRYTVSADPDVAFAGAADTILAVDQPAANHNGGMIVFGPDGFLYVGLGDGGTSANGQDSTTLLGKILRLNVDGAAPYAIPATNPFVGRAGWREEIWALGLRNPWRFSFDRDSGGLYIGDVGASSWEEIDVEAAGAAGGLNYGWSIMEGASCFGGGTCNQTGLTLPVLQYSHADGCAVVGGYVYRGTAVPALAGLYVYSDNCTGFIRTFRLVNGTATSQADRTGTFNPGTGVTSFGEDAAGNLYVLTQGGRLLRFTGGV